ncbi:MAG: Ppx/GppA phosphatase family protein [Deltaproteobacteria bacterium]|nr:Ppx/GppA phosphatase family protein [Deltaproteobacteria bacterium]
MSLRTKKSADSGVLGAIDVGTNAVRLKIVRRLADGSLQSLHEERDAVRPGEGVFKTRVLRREVANRLIATMRRYKALCVRHNAHVRAVATSAIREARNGPEIVRRVQKECDLALEVISGREEARLICKGVLRGRSPRQRALLIDIGGGSTEVSTARGEKPSNLWSIALGAVRLSETFDISGVVGKKQLDTIRAYADEAVVETLPARIVDAPKMALGTSGSIRAVIGFAAAEGTAHATRKQISRAVKAIAAMSIAERRRHFDPSRAEIVLAGAVIIEALFRHMHLESITAVPSGLRDGILVDLLGTRPGQPPDFSLSETCVTLGRRFDFAEKHALQVGRFAVGLFDDLASLHRLPVSLRPLLETAALLHDLGHAVNYQKHHRHTQYLISNADIPGLTDDQRNMVARIARYHRGSYPSAEHDAMRGASADVVRQIRKLSILLRLADAFDRSHHQPVRKVSARNEAAGVRIRLSAARPVELELWDAERERAEFFRVFRKRLTITKS